MTAACWKAGLRVDWEKVCAFYKDLAAEILFWQSSLLKYFPFYVIFLKSGLHHLKILIYFYELSGYEMIFCKVHISLIIRPVPILHNTVVNCSYPAEVFLCQDLLISLVKFEEMFHSLQAV